jgi:predicted dehydrogenase
MRCVLVGLGSIGKRHVRALRAVVPDVEIVALRSGRGEIAAAGLVDREIHDRGSVLDAKPDFAIVADPASQHAESAAPLISAGIPVLLEKPIACDAVGMAALQAASRNNTRVLVGYVLRHDPGLTTFRDAILTAKIGRLLLLDLEAGQALADWRPGQDPARSISAKPETGGGVLFELSHEIDAACWFLDDVDVVHAVANSLGELRVPVEDTAALLLRSRTGSIATVKIDMARRVGMRRYRAVGTAGTVQWDAGTATVSMETEQGTQLLYQGSPDRDAVFRKQIQHFIDVANGKAKALCTLEDGAKALAVVLDARRKAGLDAVSA